MVRLIGKPVTCLKISFCMLSCVVFIVICTSQIFINLTVKYGSNNRNRVSQSDSILSVYNKFQDNIWNTKLRLVFKENQASEIKRILMWNKIYSKEGLGNGWGKKPFDHCEISNCEITSDHKYYTKSDAVLFFMRYLKFNNTNPIPPHLENQQWIFFIKESPHYGHFRAKSFDNMFNLTMTYRMDSDIPVPYGAMRPLHQWEEKPKIGNMAAGKTKLVAWFVSNCNTKSKREAYVRTLSKYIPVDIYGNCGPLNCTEKELCMEMLSKTYKFYLALENSICKDYASEKLWNMMEINIIPVVMGGFDYKSYLPPKSVIDVRDFNKASDLADYLRKLDNNDALYNEYFEWKREFKVMLLPEIINLATCQLCYHLHKKSGSGRVQTYKKLTKWWNSHSDCLTSYHYWKHKPFSGNFRYPWEPYEAYNLI